MTLPAGWRLAVWPRFTTRLRRETAARAGLSRRELADHLRVSYGKVAEF